LPFTADLPNGWTVRFSACSITDAQGRITEFGVEPSPNCKVDITDADLAAGKDAILEHAFSVIQQMQ
ncbi:MAG: peptidase S41, partial [Muribaculaceae bacterium]|nr:peptidase S41 [Muribaculaceae bacterium]